MQSIAIAFPAVGSSATEMNVGDVVDFRVTRVAAYACWGTADSKTGFSHCVDWSAEKPIPEKCHPVVGQTIKARVFHLTVEGEQVPADVSHDGEIRVDFGCSFALVDDMLWKRHNEQKEEASPRQVGGIERPSRLAQSATAHFPLANCLTP